MHESIKSIFNTLVEAWKLWLQRGVSFHLITTKNVLDNNNTLKKKMKSQYYIKLYQISIFVYHIKKYINAKLICSFNAKRSLNA